MLSADQTRQFETDGYLVLENVVPEPILRNVRDEYGEAARDLYRQWRADGLVADPPDGLSMFDMIDRARAAGIEWYQPLDISLPHEDIREDTPFHFGPATFDLVTCPEILDIAESLLGGELTSSPIQHVRIKPPQRELPEGETRAHVGVTDWHQDRGVGHESADESEVLTVWIAVTDATLENGCLKVVPGPHDRLYPHCPKSQTAIADGHVDERRATAVPVGSGGVILLHPLTPHCAGPNETDGYRWSFDIRFNVTGQPTGRDHFPGFVARSRKNPGSELRDWRDWKAAWEGARTSAAESPHIPQHRWSHDSPSCA